MIARQVLPELTIRTGIPWYPTKRSKNRPPPLRLQPTRRDSLNLHNGHHGNHLGNTNIKCLDHLLASQEDRAPSNGPLCALKEDQDFFTSSGHTVSSLISQAWVSTMRPPQTAATSSLTSQPCPYTNCSAILPIAQVAQEYLHTYHGQLPTLAQPGASP